MSGEFQVFADPLASVPLPDVGDPVSMRDSRALLQVPFKGGGSLLVGAGYRLPDDDVIAVALHGWGYPSLAVVPARATGASVARLVWKQWKFADPDRRLVPGAQRLVPAKRLATWPRLELGSSPAWSVVVSGREIGVFDLGVDESGRHLVFVDVPLLEDGVARTVKGKTYQYGYGRVDDDYFPILLRAMCGACWESDVHAWRREITRRCAV